MHSGRFFVLRVALMLAAFWPLGMCAQTTPSVIIAVKLPGYRQISATDIQPAESHFGVQLAMPTANTSAFTVQLRTPANSTEPLTRDPTDGSFALERTFETRAQMDATFPDGAYTISVSNGTSSSTTTFTLTTTPDIPPTLVKNFDALQTIPDSFTTISWSAITGVKTQDFLSVTVAREDGTEVYATSDSFSPLSTSTNALNLPTGVALDGELDYASIATTGLNGGATTLALGRGFALYFPLRVVLPPPVITRDPVSQVGEVGGPLSLSIIATGRALTYRWRKDDIVIPGATGATLSFSSLKASDGGRYSVEVSNSSGTVTSRSAPIVVAPVLNVTTYAGAFTAGNADGPLTSAQFSSPQGIAFDANGNLYIADTGNGTIRKLTATGIVSTLAGTAGQLGAVDGTGAAAQFRQPTGLATDAAGNLYITDIGNCTVRKITPAGIVTTLAGVAQQQGYVDGPGATARFRPLSGIAVDATGNIFVSDQDNNVIRRITPAGVVSTFAGRAGSAGYADGPATNARFATPRGLAFDLQGNLFVADTFNLAIRRITPAGVVTTLAIGSGMNLTYPENLVVDRTGAIYVLNAPASILRITPDGLVMKINGRTGKGGLQDGSGSLVSFFLLTGITLDPTGAIFIADATAKTFYRATLVPGSPDPLIDVAIEPRSQTVASGATAVFAVEAAGPSLTYQWLKDGQPIANANGPLLLVQNPSEGATYSVLLGNAAGPVTVRPATLTLSTTKDVGRIINLSILSSAGRDAQTLIVGFALGGGAASAPPASVLLRGIGPSLAPFGVANLLADPSIALYRGTQLVDSNNDWAKGNATAATAASVGAFSLNASSLDAALFSSLTPGSYSVQVTGADSRTGVALAELYDAGPRTASSVRLTNVSARTQVGSGADSLVAGFVIGGSTSKTLLVRGIGPALSAFGLTNYLADPKLELYSGSTRIATNDNWGGDPTLNAAARVTGAFNLWDSNSRDAALLVTLGPGSYTAQLSGSSGANGVGLVEIYELP